MSGKLKKTGRIILIVAILGIALFCFIKKNYENPLKNIREESSELPNYVVYGVLYSDYGRIYVPSICEKKSKERYLDEIFCIKNGKAYLMYADYSEGARCWVLASVDLETSELQTCCELPNAAKIFDVNFSNDYMERDGYYLEGKIVLNDRQTVLEYDVESQNLETYDYYEYDFPKCTVYGEYIDNETVQLNLGNSIRRYTLEEMAEKSDSIAKIFALKNEKTWCGDSYLYRFFADDNVQFIGDKVYTIGNCFNYSGQAYTVILEYDVEEDSWKYVTNCYTGNPASPYNCYVIPSE